MNKSTWIIFALIVALGVIYVASRQQGESVGVKKIPLAQFDARKVDAIEISSRDTIHLKKVDGKWKVKLDAANGKFVDADVAAVDAMLDAADHIRHSYYVTNQESKLLELGFGDGERTGIKIMGNDRVLWQLTLGKDAEGSGRYAMLPNDKDIYVVRGPFWHLTKSSLNDWRERQINTLKPEEISAVEILKLGKPFLRIHKKDNDTDFELDKKASNLPDSFRANAPEVASLVRNVADLRASGFVDEDVQLGSPLLSIKIAKTGQADTVIDIYPHNQENYLLKVSGREQLFTISPLELQNFDKRLDDLRDLQVMSFDKNNIVAVRLNAGREFAEVKKINDAWEMVHPKALPKDFVFDPSAVDTILSDLLSLQALRLATSKDVPQAAGWHTHALVELTDKNGQKLVLYSGMLKAKSDEVLVKGSIDNLDYVAAKKDLQRFMQGIKAFKKEEFAMPPIGPGTKGFESLPVDIQRKLMNAMKRQKAY